MYFFVNLRKYGGRLLRILKVAGIPIIESDKQSSIGTIAQISFAFQYTTGIAIMFVLMKIFQKQNVHHPIAESLALFSIR